jgi:hypothetical protein
LDCQRRLHRSSNNPTIDHLLKSLSDGVGSVAVSLLLLGHLRAWQLALTAGVSWRCCVLLSRPLVQHASRCSSNVAHMGWVIGTQLEETTRHYRLPCRQQVVSNHTSRMLHMLLMRLNIVLTVACGCARDI